MIEIAEKRSPRKYNTRAPAVEPSLPGLLAMARWAPRRLSIEHVALACDIGYLQASRNLAKLRANGLVTAIKTVRPYGGGGGMLMHALTVRGHDIFKEAYGWDLPYIKPCSEVPHGLTFAHHHTTLAAMIVAERDIDRHDYFSVVQRFAEFKWDTRKGGLGKYPTAAFLDDGKTRVKWDASLTIKKSPERIAVPYLIETDMGSEQIIETGHEHDSSVTAKLLRLWCYLKQENFDERFGSSQGTFKVLFVTTTQRRIDNIIARIAWDRFRYDDGSGPEKIFKFATQDDAIGRQKSPTDSTKGDFWGPVWRSCDDDVFRSLLKPVTNGQTAHTPDLHVVAST